MTIYKGWVDSLCIHRLSNQTANSSRDQITFFSSENIPPFCYVVQLSNRLQLKKPWTVYILVLISNNQYCKNMRTRLKIEQNVWSWIYFRSKHVDSIKLSVFILSKIVLYISTATICLPTQIWIIFKISTETLGLSALISVDAPRWLSPLPRSCLPSIFYRIERLRYNKMKI